MCFDDEVVTISAIEHYAYCPRQFMLIFLESTFEDNALTLQGRQVHKVVDDACHSCQPDARVEYAVPLWSDRLGLVGRADVVELTRDGSVVPTEYKRGVKKHHRCHDLQLCAQALCLEEMLGMPVMRGCIYYSSSRRLREVMIDDALRNETLRTIDQVRAAMRDSPLFPPAQDSRCVQCSLLERCQPQILLAASRWTSASMTEKVIGDDC